MVKSHNVSQKCGNVCNPIPEFNDDSLLIFRDDIFHFEPFQ